MTARITEGSNNKASDAIGDLATRRTVDRTVQRVMTRAVAEGYETPDDDPRILVIDIETAPIVGYLWSLWQNNVALNQVESQSYILSWAAKWVGDDEVFNDCLYYQPMYEPGMENDYYMLEGIWNKLDEADFVVAHNGNKFDIKRLNTQFLLKEMPPPSPYKSIDTLQIAKRRFAFDSNKLDNLLNKVCGYGKTDAGGMETWIGCLKGDPASWEKLMSYNIDDVTMLEELYLKIRGWDSMHPSASLHNGTRGVPTCNVCKSENVEVTGKTYSTRVSVFPLWRCNDCGNNMRSRQSILTKDDRDVLLIPVK
jgi:hypothetical protein